MFLLLFFPLLFLCPRENVQKSHVFQHNDEYQFFAPTDAALSKVPQAKMDYLATNAGRNELKQLLSHHIVADVIPSGDLKTNSTTTVASLLPGSNLTVVKSADGQIKVNGIATVETPDVVSVSHQKFCYRSCWKMWNNRNPSYPMSLFFLAGV
jgi:Fasciclin domain